MWWRIRFRLRSLVIVVAVVAVAIGGETLRRRSVAYRMMAADYARFEAGRLKMARMSEAGAARRQRYVEELSPKTSRSPTAGRGCENGYLPRSDPR
jgi:hypothetical protein